MPNRNRPPVRGVPVFSKKRGGRWSCAQRPSRPQKPATAQPSRDWPSESPMPPRRQLDATAPDFQPQRALLDPNAPEFVIESTLIIPEDVEEKVVPDCEVSLDRDEQSGKLMTGLPRTYKVTQLLRLRDLCRDMPPCNFLVDIDVDCDRSEVDDMITCITKPLPPDILSFNRRPSHRQPYRRFPRKKRPSRPKLSDARVKTSIPLSARQKLMRKTRGILNKISPESFDRLCELLTELIENQVSCYEEMEIVFDAVVGVGIAQSKFCTVYVDLIKRLSESLTSRIQSWSWVQEKKIKPCEIVGTVVQECCEKYYFDYQQTIHPQQVWHVEEIVKGDYDIELPLEIAELMDGYLQFAGIEEEYYRLKKNFVGIEHLVGELVRQQMLSTQTVLDQIEKLLHPAGGIRRTNDVIPAEMEGICAVLRVCGSLLESEEPRWLEECLGAIKKATDSMDKRMMFMVMDLREFQSAGWTDPRKVNKPIAGERQFKFPGKQSTRTRGNPGFRGGRRGAQRGKYRPRRR